MGLRFTYPRSVALTGIAVMVCGPLLSVVSAGHADAATTTTSVPASTTTNTAAGPTPVGPSTTATTTPQHVINQPNIDALTPHVVMLQGKGVQYQSSSGVESQGIGPSAPSYLSSPGGPYLYDSKGRVILMHGVNVVYKHAPYIAYPDPGEPWNFDATDAAKMQRLGFNVVRLGIEWQALEPGSGGPNQPQICAPGAPETTGAVNEWNQTVAEQYLSHVAATVKLLAKYGIYTLLDMHQDVYNQNFRGEGAPDWAVCTNNVPIVPKGGRWSNNYSNPTLQTAVGHFWANDVVGNLQGNYDLVWKTVAQKFKNNPWVVGYDPGRLVVDLHRTVGVLLHREGPPGRPGQRGRPVDLPARRSQQRCDPDHPVGRQPSPDLRRTGHLLGDGREHPLTAGPAAVQARGVQLPHLLRRPEPRDG
jgi:hypothetical protein